MRVRTALCAAAPSGRPLLVAALLPLALMLAAGLFLGLVMSRGDGYFVNSDPMARLFDEGVVLDAAARIRDGQVPYRDFAHIYAPGQAYVLAAIFGLFGETIATAHAYDLVVRILLCLSVYVLARHLMPARVAVVSFLLATIWLAAAYYYLYPMVPALLGALLSVTCALRYLATPSPAWLFAAGGLAALTLCVRHDVGVYLVASEAVVFLGWGLARHASTTWLRRPSPLTWGALRAAGPYLAGLGLPLALVLIALLAVVPVAPLWDTFVILPLTVFRSAFALPYPSVSAPGTLIAGGPAAWGAGLTEFAFDYTTLDWVLFWTAPLLAILGLLAAALVWRRRRPTPDSAWWGIALVSCLGVAFFNQALNRADRLHSLPGGLLASIVLCGLVARAFAVPRLRIGAALALLLAIPVLLPTYLFYPLSLTRDALQWEAGAACADGSTLPRAAVRCVFVDLAQAIHFVQEQTEPTEAIFVGNARHDRTGANEALFYFLADRRNGTRFDDLVAGLVGTAAAQASITTDLQRNEVRWIVRSARFDGYAEPNLLGRPTGTTDLDDFIASHYVLVQQAGSYTIWRRR